MTGKWSFVTVTFQFIGSNTGPCGTFDLFRAGPQAPPG